MATGNTKTFELKIGKTGLIIVITGMTAFLCAAFLFGIDVGKNIDIYPAKISSLPQKMLALVWRPAKIQVAKTAPEENINLNYHNALMNKKGVPELEPAVEKQPTAAQPTSQEEMQKGKFHIETGVSPVTTKENNAENGAQPTKEESKNKTEMKDKKEIKEKEDALKKIINNYKFMVQVASLKERSKADQVSKKVTALGFKPEIIETEIKGKGTVYRVVVAGFNDKLKAQDTAKKITNKTKENCIVKQIDK